MKFRRYNYFSKQNFIGHGGYFELGKVAYPLIILGASNVIMMFCDRLMLGRASTAYMNAALPAGATYFTFFCFYLVMCGFTSALVAQLFGAKRLHECAQAAWNGFYLAIGVALIIGFINPFFTHMVIDLSLSPEVTAAAHRYLEGMRFSGVFACLSAPLWGFFSGRGITWPVAVVSCAVCALNILLNYMFIFGNLGAPEWGAFGAGVATTLSGAVGFMAAAVFFVASHSKALPTLKLRRFRLDFVKKIVYFGTPAGMQVLFELASFTLLTLLVGKMGADTGDDLPLTVTSIALSINNLSFSPLLGISDATAIVVGQYIGRGRPAIASRATYRAWRAAMLYMLFCAAVYLLFPRELASLFREAGSSDAAFADVLEAIVPIMVCAALFNLSDAVKYVFMGGLRGAGDTKCIFYLVSGAQWIFMVPGLFVLTMWFNVSVIGIWIFLIFCSTLEGGLIYWRYRSNKWRNIKLIDAHPENMVPLEECEHIIY